MCKMFKKKGKGIIKEKAEKLTVRFPQFYLRLDV
jgi:hypothetical protein